MICLFSSLREFSKYIYMVFIDTVHTSRLLTAKKVSYVLDLVRLKNIMILVFVTFFIG